MADANAARLQTEAPRRFANVVGFLKNAETKYPDLAGQLPGLLSRMLGGQTFDPQLMVQNESFVAGGAAALGYWLSLKGFGGFEVKGLGLADIAVKTTAGVVLSQITRDQFFADSGVDRKHHQQLQDAMVDLSGTIGQALEVGYKPKQVVAALFIQSTAAVGDERSETSLPTRDMLIKASGGKLPQVNQILNRWVQGK